MDETLSTANPANLPSFPLSDPASVAETLLTRALTACAEQAGLHSEEAVVDLLRRGDQVAHRSCQQQLTRNIAEYLSKLDGDIVAVYGYECPGEVEKSVRRDKSFRLSIHLAVWTRRRTAALISVMAALDRALAQALADYSGTQEVTHILNVHVIDDDAVRNQTGYAALLFSPHHKPVLVWKR